MRGSTVARRYAQAFLDSDLELEKAVPELSRFAQAFAEASEFRHVLLNPAFTQKEEREALDAILEELQLSEVVRRFIRLVAERRRMGDIVEIAETVRRLHDERTGRVQAKVESAEPLSEDALTRLKVALEKRTGKKVELEVSVDPGLIGGVRTSVESTVFDGTIRTELSRLREALTASE